MPILRAALALACLALACPFAGFAGAQEESGDSIGPLVTDRPDATESSETVAPGMFQLESGYTFARIAATDLHSLGEVLVRIGLVDDLELRLGLNSFAVESGTGSSARGFQNLGVGAKLRILSGGGVGHGRPTVAVLVGSTLPTGSDGVDERSTRPEARLAAAWDLSEAVSLSSNLIWSSIRDDEADERFAAWGFSLALGYGLSERWGSYVEYFGAYPEGGRTSENFLNAGLTYLVHDGFQLDGRVGYGLNGRDDDFFIGIGGAVRWE